MKIPVAALFILGGLLSVIATIVAGVVLFNFSFNAIEQSIRTIGESQADSVSGRVEAAISRMDAQRTATKNHARFLGAAPNTVVGLSALYRREMFNKWAAEMTTDSSTQGFEIAITIPGNVPRNETTGYFKLTLYYDPLKDGGREYLLDLSTPADGDAFTEWYPVTFNATAGIADVGEGWGSDDFAFYYNYQSETLPAGEVNTAVSVWMSSDTNVYWFIQSWEMFLVDGKWVWVTVYETIDTWYQMVLAALNSETGASGSTTANNATDTDTVILVIEPVLEVVVATSIAEEKQRQDTCYPDYDTWWNQEEDICLRRKARNNTNSLIGGLTNKLWKDEWATVGVAVPTRSENVKVDGINYLAVVKQLANKGELRPMLIWARNADKVLGPVVRSAIITILLCCLFILLSSLLLVAVAGAGVLSPMNAVTDDMDRLTRLEEVDTSGDSSSAIAEVSRLQTHFRQMAKAVNSFSMYVPRDVVKDLMLNSNVALLGMVERNLTVMFMDIANFTTICERLSQQSSLVNSLLGTFFNANTETLMQHGATIDKFIGDCIMCFWNAPLTIDRQAFRAICAGIDVMHRCATDLHEAFDRHELPLKVRIGAHSGPALVGNIGSDSRMNYTTLGDTVNTAARLEALGKHFSSGFIISDTTLRAAIKRKNPNLYFCHRYLGDIIVKGKQQALKLYDVLGIPDPASRMFTRPAAEVQANQPAQNPASQEEAAAKDNNMHTPAENHDSNAVEMKPVAEDGDDKKADYHVDGDEPEIERQVKGRGDIASFGSSMTSAVDTSQIFAQRGDNLYLATLGYDAVAIRESLWIDADTTNATLLFSEAVAALQLSQIEAAQAKFSQVMTSLQNVPVDLQQPGFMEDTARRLKQCETALANGGQVEAAYRMDEK